MYSELLSIDIEAECYMEISEPDFSYLRNFSSPTRTWYFQVFKCLETLVALSLDHEILKKVVFN